MNPAVKPDDGEDGPEPGDECGRWSNGSLGRYCAKAGSEECDFECPYRITESWPNSYNPNNTRTIR